MTAFVVFLISLLIDISSLLSLLLLVATFLVAAFEGTVARALMWVVRQYRLSGRF